MSAAGGGAAGRPGSGTAAGHEPRIVRRGGDPPSPWEEVNGFCRVVSAGGWVHMGGTTSVDPSGVILGETPYEQTMEILRKIGHELGRAGAALSDVVWTRIYVTDMSRAEEVGRAHAEAFAQGRPVMTLVEISGLIDPRMMVEIEAAAYIGP